MPDDAQDALHQELAEKIVHPRISFATGVQTPENSNLVNYM